IDAGKFERDLILRIELAPPGLVAAEKRVASRADDELVRRIIAAAAENGVMHRSKDIALVGTRLDRRERRVMRRIAKLRGLSHIFDLGVRLHRAQARHDMRRIDEARKTAEGLVQRLSV